MRPSGLLPLVALFSGLAFGCAHTIESASQERTVVAVDVPGTTVITETPPPIVVEAPVARPRLSQVVTLGQGGSEGYTGAPPVNGQGAASGTNVVVNNNVTIVNGQPAYGGYGYGYGYGGGYGGVGYGARDGYGRSSSTAPRNAWAPNGWEGAQRTAAPGTTPNVGGNWAPAQSHGPSQLK